MTEELKLLVVPLVAALMMAVKMLPPLQPETRRWALPWIAMLLGVGACVLLSEPFSRMVVFQGIVYGLAAAGLYDAAGKPAVAALASAKTGIYGVVLLLGLGLVFAGGCAMPTAAIRVLAFERESLDQDAAALCARYQADRGLVEGQIESLWEAAYADIEAHQPADPAWTVTTIRGARAAVSLLEDRLVAMKENLAVGLDNVAARREALDRAASLIEKSQQWPADAKEWAAELRELLEKKGGAP